MKDCSDWIRRGCYLDKPHSRTGATALHVAASKGYNQLIGLFFSNLFHKVVFDNNFKIFCFFKKKNN